MIRVFYGNDRVKILENIKKILGEEYEVFEGENLKTPDIYNICKGNNLFSAKRKILIKDLTPARKAAGEGSAGSGKGFGGGSSKGSDNGPSNDFDKSSNNGFGGTGKMYDEDFYETLGKLTDTKHEIIIWETTVSLKKSYKDFIKDKNVEVKKFDLPEVDKWAVFKVYDTALYNGEKAVAQLNELKKGGNGREPLDPYSVVGAFASSAMRKFEANPGAKEKRVLKELSKLDMKMKDSGYDPWLLISSFLLRVSGL